eukprot:Hpha_TRINITY_DN9440_c0_g1::TRINITY_DN9440_c0_g1_i1::g.139121::m.139121
MADAPAAAAADLTALSKEQLVELLAAEDKKMRETQKAIRELKSKERDEKMKGAHKKTEQDFSEEEQKKVRDAFEMFDKDKSGKIDLKELRAVSRELNHEMGEEEAAAAMKELDKNGDGTLDWGEFLLWWGADSTRGGYRGAKLAAIKAALVSNFLRDELQSIAETGSRQPALGHRLRSVDSQVTVGKVGKSFKPASEIQLVVTPNTIGAHEQEVTKILPADFPYRDVHEDDTEEGEEQKGNLTWLVFQIKLQLREGTTDAKIDLAMEKLQPLLDMMNKKMYKESDGTRGRLEVVRSKDPVGLTVRYFFRAPRAKDKLRAMAKAALGSTSKNPDDCAADVLGIYSALWQSKRSVGDTVRLDNEDAVVDFFEAQRYVVHGEAAPHVQELLQAGFFYSLFKEDDADDFLSYAKKIVAFIFPVRLFQAFSAQAAYNSPAQSIAEVAKTLGSFPVDYAKKKGKMSDKIEQESKKLIEHFDKMIRRMHKQSMPVSFPLAMILMKMKSNEKPWDVVKAIASVVEGVSEALVMHPMLNAKLTLNGFHVLRNLSLGDDDLDEKLEAALVNGQKVARGGRDPEDESMDQPYPTIYELLKEGTEGGDKDPIANLVMGCIEPDALVAGWDEEWF